MPQQYHSMSDAMYPEYRPPPPPPSYQDNYLYPHSNYQHYRSSMPSSGVNEYGYDYNQPYYAPLQSTNSYGMLPSYNSSNSNAFSSNFHGSPFSTNFHGPSYPPYENVSTSPTSALNIKTEQEPESSESLGNALIKSSPIESSDRSESSFSSKLEVSSKHDGNMTESSETIGNSEQNSIETMHQNSNEENISSKLMANCFRNILKEL